MSGASPRSAFVSRKKAAGSNWSSLANQVHVHAFGFQIILNWTAMGQYNHMRIKTLRIEIGRQQAHLLLGTTLYQGGNDLTDS